MNKGLLLQGTSLHRAVVLIARLSCANSADGTEGAQSKQIPVQRSAALSRRLIRIKEEGGGTLAARREGDKSHEAGEASFYQE